MTIDQPAKRMRRTLMIDDQVLFNRHFLAPLSKGFGYIFITTIALRVGTKWSFHESPSNGEVMASKAIARRKSFNLMKVSPGGHTAGAGAKIGSIIEGAATDNIRIGSIKITKKPNEIIIRRSAIDIPKEDNFPPG